MSVYSDLDYDLPINDFGDTILLEDIDAIQQSIKTIILTRLGTKTKFIEPIFGSGVVDMLFEKIDAITITNIQDSIELAIENWEPRVEVNDLDIQIDSANINQLRISIIYKIVHLNITDEVVIDLTVIS